MIEHRRLKKIDLGVLIWGLVIVSMSVPFWSLKIFLGAALGSGIGFFNWLGFRYLMERIVAGRNRARWGFLLAAKSTLVLAAVSAVVLYAPVNAIAFVIGVSSLILGIFTHAILSAGSSEQTALNEDL